VGINARGSLLLVDLIRNDLATAEMIHQNSSFNASPSELFNIYLDSAFTMIGRFPCNG